MAFSSVTFCTMACAVVIVATFAVATFAVPADPSAATLGMDARTPYGLVRGFYLNGTIAWRGIPYAAPPIGDLRFRPPQPPASWPGVRETVDFAPSCIQMGSPNVPERSGPAWNSINLTRSSEDCLYLNVYAPAISRERLPVMVYLHAGEFRFGASNDEESNWPYLTSGNAILITLNYRLSLFGFAALDALRSRDPSGSSGNYGMQDQRAALQWVKRCISSFGGDPHRITIFGESSGGTSVGFHLFSAASRGLFKQAILQSPGLTQSRAWPEMEANTQYAVSALTAAGVHPCAWPAASRWFHFPGLVASELSSPLATATSVDEARELCEARADCFVLSVGSNGTTKLYGLNRTSRLDSVFFSNLTEALGRNPGVEVQLRLADAEAAMQCLLAADAGDLVTVNLSPPYDDTFYSDASAPTEDGVELATALAVLARGPPPRGVRLLAGSNLDEGTMFMDECPPLACNASEAEFEAWAVKMYGPTLGAKVPSLYRAVEQPAPLCRTGNPYRPAPDVETSRAWQSAMRSAGDNAILCRTRELLRAAQRLGSTVWWYYFAVTPIHSVNEPDSMTAYLGAFHGAEVPFVFGDGFELSSKGERSLSKAMGCYWVNFAATGDPNEGPSNCTKALSLTTWPEFGKGDAMQFTNTTISTRPGLKAEQCELFAQLRRSAHPDVMLV